MLHNYSFANFQSFKEPTLVNLTLNRKVPSTNWVTQTLAGNRVTKVMAAIGANASGKTTLLKALCFLGWFITESFELHPEANLPVTPHATAENQPSEFKLAFDFEGSLWHYELTCNSKYVLHEALYQKQERLNYIFKRNWDEATNTYIVKQQNFGLGQVEASKVRPNVSLVAWAAQYNVPLATRMIKLFITSNINVRGKAPMVDSMVLSAATHFAEHANQKDIMVKLLSNWDLGLSDVRLAEVKEFSVTPIDTSSSDNRKKQFIPIGLHKSHQSEFALPFFLESSGTQSAFVLLHRLLPVLEMGGIAVIDELENDLHPHMLEPILDLFASPTTNPHQAQLLFTCHSMEILNQIHKSQVMLVEKDDACMSRAIRMDDINGIRSEDNLYAKYMAGSYGAVPKL